MPSLDALLAPRSIAIIGASDDASRIGGRPLASLLRMGYGGKIFPVNPKRPTVQGLPAYRSALEMPEAADCAIIAVPADAVISSLKDCAQRGIKAAIIFSAGFAETNAQGGALQDEISALARQSGMRIVGPNCMGLFNANQRAYLTFTAVLEQISPVAGRLALISQSGGYASAVLKIGAARGLFFGCWVTTGNECDVEVGELMEALAPRDDVSAIVVYVEGVRNGQSFLRGLAAARQRGKPVLVMKVGSTESGAQAVASHTASLAGTDWVYDAVLRENGALRMHSTEELIDLCLALESVRSIGGARLGVVTTSGGIGAQIADAATHAGLSMPRVGAADQARLLKLAPQAATANPVDVTGQVISDPGVLARCLEVLLESRSFDAIYVYLGLIANSPSLGQVLLATLSEARQRHPDVAIMVSVIGGTELVEAYQRAGFIVAEDPTRAVKILGGLSSLRTHWTATDLQPPIALATLPWARTFNEPDAKNILAGIGIPAPEELFFSMGTQVHATNFPVALKVVSADLQHKSDVGGVMLDIRDDVELQSALSSMARAIGERAPSAHIDGHLVSPMIRGGVECFLGAHMDPVFGPVVLFGLGGVAVEIFKDVTFALVPVSEDRARDMIRAIRSYPLLDGYRNRPRADVDALARAICNFSRFVASNADRLHTAEINPLRVMPEGEGVVALDAVLQTRAQPIP